MENKENFLENKKRAIAELVIKANYIMKQLKDDPEFEPAMQDRAAHIERGELWLTPAAIKYAPIFAQLAQIQLQINAIRATAFDPKKSVEIVAS